MVSSVVTDTSHVHTLNHPVLVHVMYTTKLAVSNRVWFGLFVHPFSHTCNVGHISYSLQFVYYNTTYNIWTSTQYNTINNNRKFKDHLEVESIATSRNMCIYINMPKSYEFKLKVIT